MLTKCTLAAATASRQFQLPWLLSPVQPHSQKLLLPLLAAWPLNARSCTSKATAAPMMEAAALAAVPVVAPQPLSLCRMLHQIR